MRCETCQGIGKVSYDQHPRPKPEQFGSIFPCPDCGGCGVAHCCDGITACNDLVEADFAEVEKAVLTDMAKDRTYEEVVARLDPRPDFTSTGDVGYQRTGNVRF